MNRVCSKCGIGKDLNEFHKNNQGVGGRDGTCKVCRNKRKKELSSPQKSQARNLMHRYGMTQSELSERIKSQDSVCAICKEEPKRWVVDHCHNSGDVRGLLCHGCNVFIARMDIPEWRKSAMEYLGL